MPIPESIKSHIRSSSSIISHIDLSNQGINNDDLSELQELLQGKQLGSIDLADNNITAAGCQILCLIQGLKKANLSGCHVGDEGINYLIKSNMDSLDLSGCGLTKNGAETLIKHLDKFKSLEVLKNPRIPENLLYQIRSKFIPGLKNTAPFSSPIGIDLGQNIHSIYNFSNRNSKEMEEKIPFATSENIEIMANQGASKLFELYGSDIEKMSPPEKEQFLKQFCKHFGFEVELKPAPTLKV